MIRARHLAAGLILATAEAAAAQDLPAALPPPVSGPVPHVVVVPPEGVQPSWRPGGPIDPIAVERKHRPGFIERKISSWHWHRHQGKVLGYPEEFVPRPLGAALYDQGRTMTANGAQARLVLYHYDFIDGTNQLNDRGRVQLSKIAQQLAVSPYPMLIESTPEAPSLAESRRFAVLAALAGSPNPVMSDRVLVGLPLPVGISGTHAQVINSNALNRVQQYGPPIPINSNGVNSPSGVTNPLSGSLPNQ